MIALLLAAELFDEPGASEKLARCQVLEATPRPDPDAAMLRVLTARRRK